MGRNPEVEYFGCLGFAAIAVSHLMRTVDPALLLGKASKRAVFVGFDSGDMLEIGTVSGSGFVPHFTRRPAVPKIARTPSQRRYYQLINNKQGRWWLDEPWMTVPDDLPSLFWTTGKPLKLKLPLRSAVMSSPRGMPVDFTFAVLDTPIVTERVGRLIAELVPEAVQLLPLRIHGKRGRYDVLNVLDVVDCVDLRRSKITPFGIDLESPPGEEQPLGFIEKLVLDHRRAKGHDFFVLAGDRSRIIVSRRVKERLESEQVTGIVLKPI